MRSATFTLPAAGAVASAALLNACQRYEPRPLDLDATRDAWLARTGDEENVRDFAARLAESDEAPTVFDPSDGLSLPEAEAVALVFNPDLRLARLDAGIAAAGAPYAGLWEDPVLGVDLERIVRGADGANPWVAGGTLGVTVPLSGRLEAAKSLAEARAGAELDRVVAREWATRAALRELWIEWSAAALRAQSAREAVARVRGVSELAQNQERAGSLSRVEARLFLLELSGREADLIALDARARELEIQVRAMLGLAPESALVLRPALGFSAPAETDEAELRAAMERSSPELASVRSQYEVAERSLRAEVRRQYPDLKIGPGYGSDQGDDRVLLGVEVALPIWNRNQRGIAEARAEREAARGRFETTYEHLASQLSVALVRHRAARARRELVESAVVPLADEQQRDSMRIAELGRVEPLLLLAAFTARDDASRRLIDARAAESIGAVRVTELIGPVPRDAAAPPREPE